MRRLAWKEGLIAAIAERTHAEPVSLLRAEKLAAEGADVEYLRVKATGRFLNDRELYLYAFDARYGPGYHVITPLQLADGRIVFVNRGYVPQGLEEREKRKAGQLEGMVEVVGLLRRPETAGPFTPTNDVARNLWYWRDLDAMAAAAVGPERLGIVPFFIDSQIEPALVGDWPKGGVTRLELPNRHLEYALTWYGLAAALLAVFVAFAVTRWQRPAH
jgi:surfeit locus 1 family protein